MNARQKAKHYKRLYEALGVTKINTNIVALNDLKHYKAEFVMPNRDVLDRPSNLEGIVTAKLLSQLEPVIKDSIVSETNPYDIDATRYSVDIWVR